MPRARQLALLGVGREHVLAAALEDPVPASAITPTSSHSSDHAARRDATGRSSDVSWCSLRDVVSPIAPAASASASCPA